MKQKRAAFSDVTKPIDAGTLNTEYFRTSGRSQRAGNVLSRAVLALDVARRKGWEGGKEGKRRDGREGREGREEIGWEGAKGRDGMRGKGRRRG